MKSSNIYGAIRKGWSSIIKRGRLKHYYLQDSKNPKSLFSRLADGVFLKLLIFVVSYIWFVQKIRHPLTSLALALVFTILLSIAISLWRRKRYQEARYRKRKEVSRKYVLDRIAQLNDEEFKWQLVKLLLNLKGFSNIKPLQKYIQADYNKNRIAIGYNHIPSTEQTSAREVYEFLNTMYLDDYEYGLFITPGTFKDSCHEIIMKISGITLELIDGTKLLDLMDQAGLSPETGIVNQLIMKEINAGLKQWSKIKKEIVTPNKVKKFLVYSLLFFIISELAKPFALYYLALSTLFFLFALLTYLMRPKEQEEPAPLSSLPVEEED